MTDKGNDKETYQAIMGQEGGVKALSSRLVTFRKWLLDFGCTVHPAVCIVNGEATDGTRNAPVLVFGPPQSTISAISNTGIEGRCGTVDGEDDRVLYDRTIGCQVRTVREMKEDQVMMTLPRSVMISPDLVASSSAGRAVLSCCQPIEAGMNFWDVFGNTCEKEKRILEKISSSSGTQLLVKILQERKKVENVLAKASKISSEFRDKNLLEYKLAEPGSISTRAAVLCFLIQQRFSNDSSPPVSMDTVHDIHTKDDASKLIERQQLAGGIPSTFGPYIRVLPPSVPLPICWKRNELALLAGCLTGIQLLQEVAAQIMCLSSDLISLVDGGILHRFPSLFPPDLLTWDRWVWAASVHASRLLPATCYFNKGESKPAINKKASDEIFYSPHEIWDELGVMIPLLDMLNHECETAQITWESPPEPNEQEMDVVSRDYDDNAKVVLHKRVKKGSQIYTNYGIECNKEIILRYGFAQMDNSSDSVPIGWGLNDCVGDTTPPPDYEPLDETENRDEKIEQSLVYESTDTDAINAWWTESRLSLLEGEIQSSKDFWNLLRKGKKMTASANSDGTFHPILLTAVVIATMPSKSIKKCSESALKSKEKVTIKIMKKHQIIIRKYLLFLFSRKLEKLLLNFNNGLNAHFNGVNLWTKATKGGLNYSNDNEKELPESAVNATSWNSFFNSFAYTAAMEVEQSRYYAIAPDSCVLSLYDGHLRSLQSSINGVANEEHFVKSVLHQLEDLGFEVSEAVEEDEDEEESLAPNGQSSANGNSKSSADKGPENTKTNQSKKDNAGNKHDGEKRERNRGRRNRRKHGPPALKLHIGNLSYQTPQPSLFEYFAKRYGRENVLECHIPTERETGKSRGFGFVTMPEGAAVKVLQENHVHEIDGRVIKIAESNTAGNSRGHQNVGGGGGGFGGMGAPNDRCITCGYRPRYCTCSTPNLSGGGFPIGGPMPMMGGGPPLHLPPPDDMYGPGPGPMPLHGGMDPYHGRNVPDFDHRGGRRRSRSWNRGRSYSRSASPRYRGGRGSRDRYYDREYRRRGRSYSRSRSRSYSRSRDRRDRDRGGRDRGRDSERDGRRGRRSRGSSSRSEWRSSRYNSRSRSLSRSRSRSQSYSKETSSRRNERERERKSNTTTSGNVDSSQVQSRSGGGSRSRSPSISLPQARETEQEHSKRDGKSRRARSKSRDRSQRSRKRNKSRRSKESSKRHASRSRSRSRSRSWKD